MEGVVLGLENGSMVAWQHGSMAAWQHGSASAGRVFEGTCDQDSSDLNPHV